MTVNCSPTFNEPVFDPGSLLFNSSYQINLNCFFLKPSSLVVSGFYIIFIIVMLPFCSLIIYHGSRQWEKNSMGKKCLSHSDCFTYHLAIMEVFCITGGILYCCGTYIDELIVCFVGSFFLTLYWYAETAFHVLTCLDRYLAVAHPIYYLGLKEERGIRIRNRIIVCVWLFCIAGSFTLYNEFIIILFLSLMLSIPVVIFCSISLLPVLNYPGKRGKDHFKRKVGQKKLKAFYTIVAILGVLVLRFTGNIMLLMSLLSKIDCGCAMAISAVWFTLPSSLVLPVIYILKARKTICRKNIQL